MPHMKGARRARAPPPRRGSLHRRGARAVVRAPRACVRPRIEPLRSPAPQGSQTREGKQWNSATTTRSWASSAARAPMQIKTAYRRLARKYHPDVSKEADAEARFKEVQEAYEVLKDPQKRAAYDQLGSEWKSGQQFRPPPDWGSGFEFAGRRAPGRPRRPQRRPRRRRLRAGLQRVLLLTVRRRLAVRRRRAHARRRPRSSRAHRHRARGGLSRHHAHARAAPPGSEARRHGRDAHAHRARQHSGRRRPRAS